jgi:hypothetical protein
MKAKTGKPIIPNKWIALLPENKLQPAVRMYARKTNITIRINLTESLNGLPPIPKQYINFYKEPGAIP